MQINGFWIRLRALFGKNRAEREMRDELHFHLEMQIAANLERGMNAEQARYAALRMFGGVEQVKEECRETRGVRWLHESWQDLRHGTRTLRKNPGFTIAAVLTLALAIGANSAIFSVVYAHILIPLPYAAPERLVDISTSSIQRGWSRTPISAGAYFDLKELSRTLADVAAYQGLNLVLTREKESQAIVGASTTWNIFSTLGVAPALGRTFLSEEDQPGGPPVAVVSHGLWQKLYGGEQDIIGKSLPLEDKSYTIVGVMPPDFNFPSKGTQVWLPLALGSKRDRGASNLSCIARLSERTTLQQARAEIQAIGRRTVPASSKETGAWSTDLTPLQERDIKDLRTALLVLLGAVGCVLLIACANVANLQLARANLCGKDLAIRAALGATRLRLIRQQLMESFILSFAGGALGVLVAVWIMSLLVGLRPPELNRLDAVALNRPVLVFTLAASLLTGLLFGLLPAVRASRLRLVETLKEDVRTVAGAPSHRRLRNFLVVVEIALAVILLIGAGLMGRSLSRLLGVDRGFDMDNVLTMDLSLPASRYSDRHQKIAFYQELLQRMRSVPGIVAAGATTAVPTTGVQMAIQLQAKDRDESQPMMIPLDAVTPDYFRAMGLQLLRGRSFTEKDRQGAPQVVIINDALAQRLWGKHDPIGRSLKLAGVLAGDAGPWRTVVGVLANSKQFGLDMGDQPQLYFSYAQWPIGYLKLVVRTTTDPMKIVPALKNQLWELDSKVPVTDVAAMTDVVAQSVAQRRFNMFLLAAFSILSLLLATVGAYGVISESVSQRTHEIGIRMALGAERSEIVGMVVGQGARLALVGLALGLAGAFGLTRVIASMLFGVTATDPATFAGVALLIAAVSFMASYVPARRTTKIDPVVALRYE